MNKKEILECILKGFLAGASICFGGFLNILCLSFNLKPLGAFLFPIGLTIILFGKFNLYTGKIGYIFENKNKKFYLSLLIMYLMNVLSSIGIGYLISLIDFKNDAINQTIKNIGTKRIFTLDSNPGDSAIKLFVLGILCGGCVFAAVDWFKKHKNPIIKTLGVFLFVFLFVYTGMEHCIADAFYMGVSQTFNAHAGISIASLVIISLGNSIGSIFIYSLVKLKK